MNGNDIQLAKNLLVGNTCRTCINLSRCFDLERPLNNRVDSKDSTCEKWNSLETFSKEINKLFKDIFIEN